MLERTQLGELPCWRIRHAGAELLISAQGAQLLSYRRDDEPPMIWLSDCAEFRRGQSVRGGVPLCWPWFGELARNPAAVQAQHAAPGRAAFHGAVRTLQWPEPQLSLEGDSLHLSFCLDSRQQPLTDWPQAAELRLELLLDQRLQLRLSTRNRGDRPLAISQALHSYLAVSDIRRVRVSGLDGCNYIDTLAGWQQRQQQGELAFAGETDRIYLGLPARLSLHDPGWGRRLQLHSQGSQSAVLWNPWIDKAQRLSGFASDAWQRMLCIETANVLDDCLQLAPGATHRLELALWSEPA